MSTRPRGLAVFPVASELGLSPGFRDTKRRKSGKPDPARHAHQMTLVKDRRKKPL